MSRNNWCKNYRAMHGNVTCNAGVAFETLKGLKFDGEHPCFNRCPDKCPSAVYRTDEEIAAEEADFRQRLTNTVTARKAIVDHCGGPWKKGMPGSSGEIPCPVCTIGKLRFSRSGYNGHIHAGCTTDGCVCWMQ